MPLRLSDQPRLQQGNDRKQPQAGYAARRLHRVPQRLGHGSRLRVHRRRRNDSSHAARPSEGMQRDVPRLRNAVSALAVGRADSIARYPRFRYVRKRDGSDIPRRDERHDKPHHGALRQGGRLPASSHRQGRERRESRGDDEAGHRACKGCARRYHFRHRR